MNSPRRLQIALLLALALPAVSHAQEFDASLEDTEGQPPAPTPALGDDKAFPPPASVETIEPITAPPVVEIPPVVAAPVAAVPPKKEKPYREVGPMDLSTYLQAGKSPKYIRVNVKNYNIRKSAEFSSKKTDNLDFRSKGGDLFAVKAVQKMNYGAAVQIHVDDKTRWIYVPYSRKADFQFCESEACFSAMAESLDFLLRGTGVTVSQAQNCGITSGPEGLVLPLGAAHPQREPDLTQDSASPVVRPSAPAAPAPRPNASMAVKPLWEIAKGRTGENYTRLLGNALDKFGKGMMSRKSLNDAGVFCPKFSALSPGQKKEFFTHLIVGMARYESGFESKGPAFDEKLYRNVSRGPLHPEKYSMGLMALSYNAMQGYPGCRMDLNRDRRKDISDPSLTVYDPQINLECAVIVMNKWVSSDGGIGLTKSARDRNGNPRYQGGANYWSTLRKTNPRTADVIATLKRFTPCWK